MIKIFNDVFYCLICSEYFEEPVECLNCHHFYCKMCVEELKEICNKNNEKFTCPICLIEPFNYKINAHLNNLLAKVEIECSKCKTRIKGIKIINFINVKRFINVKYVNYILMKKYL